MPRRRHLVAALVLPGASQFEFAAACEVFGEDRSDLGVDWYDFIVCTPSADPVDLGRGFSVATEHGLDDVVEADTVVVIPAGEGGFPTEVLEALRRAHARGARLVSLCTGAFVLAAAGLLDERPATTHWLHSDKLTARYPKVLVEPSVLYVESGRVFTAAGSAAGIDLGLHIVRQDYGADIANQVARRMVVPPHRDGGQAQFVATAVPPVEGSLAPLMDWASARLEQPLTAEAMAKKGRMSLRTLARRFEAQAGTTPHQWLTHQRVLAAQRLLETTDLSIDRVAELSGFVTAETLRHHFRQRVGTSPMAYRRRFSQSVRVA